MTAPAASEREMKLVRALHRRKEREATGRFLAEGVRVLEDLLDSEIEVQLVLAASTPEDGRAAGVLDHARRRGIAVRDVSDAHLRALAATDTPQGLVAVARMPKAELDTLPMREPFCLLVLDAVQDPGNFGTLVRTAEALGAAGVLVLPGTVDPWNPKSVRAAAGTSFRIPIVSVTWTELEPWLRERGVAILAAAADGDALSPPPPSRTALVVGNEGGGVSADVRACADAAVAVPLRGRADSLNVGVAAAILLHQLLS
jgi:RNA methyltransferase, TrmH family